jgi:hypothetical protein
VHSKKPQCRQTVGLPSAYTGSALPLANAISTLISSTLVDPHFEHVLAIIHLCAVGWSRQTCQPSVNFRSERAQVL